MIRFDWRWQEGLSRTPRALHFEDDTIFVQKKHKVMAINVFEIKQVYLYVHRQNPMSRGVSSMLSIDIVSGNGAVASWAAKTSHQETQIRAIAAVLRFIAQREANVTVKQGKKFTLESVEFCAGFTVLSTFLLVLVAVWTDRIRELLPIGLILVPAIGAVGLGAGLWSQFGARGIPMSQARAIVQDFLEGKYG